MKFLKYIIVLPLLVSYIGAVQASQNKVYTVPFSFVEVPEASKIRISYYVIRAKTLICRSLDTGIISSVEWEYKGANFKSQLPIMISDSEFSQGQWGSSGILTITNEFGPDPLIVSCEYRNTTRPTNHVGLEGDKV